MFWGVAAGAAGAKRARIGVIHAISCVLAMYYGSLVMIVFVTVIQRERQGWKERQPGACAATCPTHCFGGRGHDAIAGGWAQ